MPKTGTSLFTGTRGQWLTWKDCSPGSCARCRKFHSWCAVGRLCYRWWLDFPSRPFRAPLRVCHRATTGRQAAAQLCQHAKGNSTSRGPPVRWSFATVSPSASPAFCFFLQGDPCTASFLAGTPWRICGSFRVGDFLRLRRPQIPQSCHHHLGLFSGWPCHRQWLTHVSCWMSHDRLAPATSPASCQISSHC